MHAMQYTIALPADYDMEIIRKRVLTRGHRTDGFPGLEAKAYLLRERGVDGSPVNLYGTFYLWRETEGMNRFLWGGGGFGGIVTDFGRPAVRHWAVAGDAAGPDAAAADADAGAGAGEPTAATGYAEAVPGGVDPAEVVPQALAVLARRARTPGVYRTVLALDPQRWELTHFTLWTGAVPADEPGDRYQVLHLSHGKAVRCDR